MDGRGTEAGSGRSTAPQSEYTGCEVCIGLSVLALGLLVSLLGPALSASGFPVLPAVADAASTLLLGFVPSFVAGVLVNEYVGVPDPELLAEIGAIPGRYGNRAARYAAGAALVVVGVGIALFVAWSAIRLLAWAWNALVDLPVAVPSNLIARPLLVLVGFALLALVVVLRRGPPGGADGDGSRPPARGDRDRRSPPGAPRERMYAVDGPGRGAGNRPGPRTPPEEARRILRRQVDAHRRRQRDALYALAGGIVALGMTLFAPGAPDGTGLPLGDWAVLGLGSSLSSVAAAVASYVVTERYLSDGPGVVRETGVHGPGRSGSHLLESYRAAIDGGREVGSWASTLLSVSLLSLVIALVALVGWVVTVSGYWTLLVLAVALGATLALGVALAERRSV